jgi:hypothetical protein
MRNIEEVQKRKIDLIKEIAVTPVYAGGRLNDMFAEVEKCREEEVSIILKNSGYDFDYPITEDHVKALMIQSFEMGKSEQQSIHNIGLDK